MTERILKFEYIPLDKIEVSELNARRTKRDEGLGELANSIKAIGVQQPLVVFPEDDRFKLVIGQRRYLACKQIGEKEIPALIVEKKDETAITLASFSENIHRTELDYRDKMQVARELLSKLGSVVKVAEQLGVSTATVNNYLGYSAVPEEIKGMVSEGRISASTATRIAQSILDEKQAINIAKKVIEKPRAEDRIHFIEVAKENPRKEIGELEKIYAETRFQQITLDLTPRIAQALEQASRDYQSTTQAVATWAIEEWLQTKGFLDERAG